MTRALTGLLAVLLLAAPVAAPVAAHAAERDGPLPRLERVGPLIDADDLEPDRLLVSPPVTEVVVAADRRREVRHVVANTTDRRLYLDLDVRETRATPDGPRGGRTGAVPADAPVQLVAPTNRLVLDPGEGAVVISSAQADAGESGVFFLRASTTDDEVRATVVVAADDTTAKPELGLDLRPNGGAIVQLRTARPTVVDVRLTGRSWLGTGTDQTMADLVVGPEGRELGIDRPATRWPGPVRVGAYASAADGDASTEDGRIVLPLGALAVLGVVVLLAVARWWSRRRRASETSA